MDGDRPTDSRLSITGYNHFAVLFSLIIVIFSILFFLIWYNFDPALITIFAIFFALDALPAFYLHWEYWQKNDGEEYEIQHDRIIRHRGGTREVYTDEEIEKIKIYLSPAYYRGSDFHVLGIEAYNYARVYLTSGEELILTCLLAPKVWKPLHRLRGVPIERKKRLFSTLLRD